MRGPLPWMRWLLLTISIGEAVWGCVGLCLCVISPNGFGKDMAVPTLKPDPFDRLVSLCGRLWAPEQLVREAGGI
jgi:hypothetical protein